jgi:hypothetical protein
VFVFNVTAGGTIYRDANGNGRQDRRETGLAGVTVQLRDADGLVIGATTTGRNGSYSFDVDALGTFTVQPILAGGLASTSAASASITATRGMTYDRVNFGVRGGVVRPSTSSRGRFELVSTGTERRLTDDLITSAV